MKKFIGKTALFIGIYLLPLLGLEWYLRQPKNDDFAGKNALLEQNLKFCEVLILGSSHSLTGLNPEWLGQQSLNLANTNQPPYYDLKILEKYAPSMPALKSVIVPISYPVMFSKPDERMENLFYIHFGLPPFSGKKKLESHSALLNLGLNVSLKRLGENIDYTADNGWLSSTVVFDGSDEKSKQRLHVMHAMMDLKNLKENIAHIEAIKTLCKSRNIRLILYQTPYYPSFLAAMEKDAPFIKAFENYMATQKNNPKLEFYDFAADPAYTSAMFRDPDHLNLEGAKVLSAEFRQILGNPMGQIGTTE